MSDDELKDDDHQFIADACVGWIGICPTDSSECTLRAIRGTAGVGIAISAENSESEWAALARLRRNRAGSAATWRTGR